jgi:hypothetical protein
MGAAPHPAQSTRSAYDEDALLSIRVLGADITGPLTFGLLLAGGWQAYRTDLLGQLTGRRRGRKGRWVYDRGLGGKRVRSVWTGCGCVWLRVRVCIVCVRVGVCGSACLCVCLLCHEWGRACSSHGV